MLHKLTDHDAFHISLFLPEVMEYSGIEKMFRDAGAYYDRLTQKVNMTNPPQNKVWLNNTESAYCS